MKNEAGSAPNITQLARHLGLSVGTVSRALNGRPEVRKETRERVAEAAEALGYVPNHAGRSLRQGTTRAVGFILNSNSVSNRNAAVLYFDIINGVQQELYRHGLDLIVLTGASGEEMPDYVKRIAARKIVDGLILAETKPQDERIAVLYKSNIPFISFGRSDTEGDYPWLDVDFPGMASDAVDRLAAKGHRKIAMSYGAIDLFYTQRFFESYKASLLRNGIDFQEDYVFVTDGTVQDGYALSRKIIEMPDPPTAIINLYGTTNPGLYKGLNEFGLNPGKDIAIVGHINDVVVGPLMPALSGYSFDPVPLGKYLACMLVGAIPAYNHKASDAPKSHIFPMSYLERDSDSHPPRPDNEAIFSAAIASKSTPYTAE